ncbi:MAG: transposase [Clostridium neonatale]|uniref:transposase n=1 Tax=Clostridium neonatale TaxID=137838 RepID=UPI00397E08C9
MRSDTAMYEPFYETYTGKRGRPRKKGHRINYKTLNYTKDGKFLIAHTQAKTNLTDKIVYITVTTTDIEAFKSVRLYMSTINPDNINSFDSLRTDDSSELHKTVYNIYKIRWNIEIIFYQQKTFWSFSNYMVRSKAGIEKYVNLLGVAYTMCIILPFINNQFAEYKFQSPQELKYYLSEHIIKELFIDKLLKILQSTKNIITIQDAINYFASQDEVS